MSRESKEGCVRECDTAETVRALLGGELAAVEIYGMAIARTERKPLADLLRRLREDHADAANLLRRMVRWTGRRPSDSGPWGALAKALEVASTFAGDFSAMQALRDGEEHGLASYERLLAQEDLDPVVREAIRTKLIPLQRAHVPEIERVLTAA